MTEKDDKTPAEQALARLGMPIDVRKEASVKDLRSWFTSSGTDRVWTSLAGAVLDRVATVLVKHGVRPGDWDRMDTDPALARLYLACTAPLYAATRVTDGRVTDAALAVLRDQTLDPETALRMALDIMDPHPPGSS